MLLNVKSKSYIEKACYRGKTGGFSPQNIVFYAYISLYQTVKKQVENMLLKRDISRKFVNLKVMLFLMMTQKF